MSTTELAIVYAALILHDDDLDITAENLLALTKAANVEVQPIIASIFAKALQDKATVANLIKNIGSSSAAAPAAAAAAPSSGSAPAKAAEKKEEVKEESDEEMGFGLFD